jgi:hypothetical protein
MTLAQVFWFHCGSGLASAVDTEPHAFRAGEIEG